MNILFSLQAGRVSEITPAKPKQAAPWDNLELSQLRPTWKKQWAVNRGLIMLTFHWKEYFSSLKCLRLHRGRGVIGATPLKTAPLGPRQIVPHSQARGSLARPGLGGYVEPLSRLVRLYWSQWQNRCVWKEQTSEVIRWAVGGRGWFTWHVKFRGDKWLGEGGLPKQLASYGRLCVRDFAT